MSGLGIYPKLLILIIVLPNLGVSAEETPPSTEHDLALTTTDRPIDPDAVLRAFLQKYFPGGEGQISIEDAVKGFQETTTGPGGDKANAFRTALARLPKETLQEFNQAVSGIGAAPVTDFASALLKTKGKTKEELLAAIRDIQIPMRVATQAAFFELVNRFGQEDRQYLGFVASPEMVRTLGRDLILPFLNSEVGKKFIQEYKAQLLGDAPPSQTAEGSRKYLAEVFTAALKKWDSEHGGVLQAMGLSGADLKRVLLQFRQELGSKNLTVGVFVPEPSIDKVISQAVDVATKQLVPDIRTQAATEAAAAVERRRDQEHANHPWVPRIVNRKVNRAKPQAIAGAKDGARDAVLGVRREGDSKYYREAYEEAYQAVETKLSGAKTQLTDALFGAVEGALNPELQEYGVHLDVVKAGRPTSIGSYPQDEIEKGYSAKPYFALYERTVKPDQTVERKTYVGWYAERIDKKMASIGSLFTNGEIYSWLTQFSEAKSQ